MIAENTVSKILDISNIVDVISEFVSLRKRGINYLGLCPFHNEKTPSFSVSPSKQMFKCFGCGEAGNVISFLKKHQGFDFIESIKYLGKKYNIEIIEKKLNLEEIKKLKEKESLLIILSFASKYFKKQLKENLDGQTKVLNYLKKRGFNNEIIEKFSIGFSPNIKNAFTKKALKKSYNLKLLIKAGLTIKNYEFDRFYGRLIFPIHNVSGKIIAFGARNLNKNNKIAKYINSPETEIYQKSRELYGMYFAKNTVVKKNKCYLVEGYTDVLSLFQNGIKNVVSSSGTSLTTEQIRIIKRFTKNVCILYDGDEAGIGASLRGIDLILKEGLNVKIVLFPDGEDPDSYSKKIGKNKFIEFLKEKEEDFIHFKTKMFLNKIEKNDPIEKANLITNIVNSIAIIPDSILRSVYVLECSKILEIREEILFQKVVEIQEEDNFFKKKPEKEKKKFFKKKPEILKENFFFENQEKEIIRLILNYGNSKIAILEAEENVDLSVTEYILSEILEDNLEIETPVYKIIFEEIISLINKDEIIKEEYFMEHKNPEVCKISAKLLEKKYFLSDFWKKRNTMVQTEEMILKKKINDVLINYKLKKIEKNLIKLDKKILDTEKNNDTEFDILELIQKKIDLSKLKFFFTKEMERVILP